MKKKGLKNRSQRNINELDHDYGLSHELKGESRLSEADPEKIQKKKLKSKKKKQKLQAAAADIIQCEGALHKLKNGTIEENGEHEQRREVENGSEIVKCMQPLKSVNGNKKLKKGRRIEMNGIKVLKNRKSMEEQSGLEEDDVYQISSGDEDTSKGMQKWLNEYHQQRPGLKILQERIDDFIMAHEAQEAQARKDREAQAAEGGWTVVMHHKGRKKTTDSESGVGVGSVSLAAVVEKMGKKKEKVAPDFYNFQRREAQRNEVMMLQNKFEQDKKRIQQLRAARKFKPY